MLTRLLFVLSVKTYVTPHCTACGAQQLLSGEESERKYSSCLFEPLRGAHVIYILPLLISPKLYVAHTESFAAMSSPSPSLDPDHRPSDSQPVFDVSATSNTTVYTDDAYETTPLLGSTAKSASFVDKIESFSSSYLYDETSNLRRPDILSSAEDARRWAVLQWVEKRTRIAQVALITAYAFFAAVKPVLQKVPTPYERTRNNPRNPHPCYPMLDC